jgi:hypothetical protein
VEIERNQMATMIGKYVIIRARDAGVHAGTLVRFKGREAELKNSRRIWSWQGALSLSEVSQKGITGGKVAVVVPQIIITDTAEVIGVSKEAQKCLTNFK